MDEVSSLGPIWKVLECEQTEQKEKRRHGGNMTVETVKELLFMLASYVGIHRNMLGGDGEEEEETI